MKVREAILLLCVVFAPVVRKHRYPSVTTRRRNSGSPMENGRGTSRPTGTVTFCTKVTPARRCTGNGRASSPASVSASRNPSRTSNASCPHGSYPRRPSGRSWRRWRKNANMWKSCTRRSLSGRPTAPLTWSIRPTRDEFNRMQDCITDGLLYCMTKSGGKLKPQVDELGRQNEILCAGIAYIRKTGVGYGLENAKRQQAYEEAKGKMEALVKQTANLCAVAATHY